MDSQIIEIIEEGIEYPRSLLDAWKNGDKKESDRIQKRQLVFLAMIKGILGCYVGVVYLKEVGKSYIKVYELDLKNYTGKRL